MKLDANVHGSTEQSSATLCLSEVQLGALQRPFHQGFMAHRNFHNCSSPVLLLYLLLANTAHVQGKQGWNTPGSLRHWAGQRRGQCDWERTIGPGVGRGNGQGSMPGWGEWSQWGLREGVGWSGDSIVWGQSRCEGEQGTPSLGTAHCKTIATVAGLLLGAWAESQA